MRSIIFTLVLLFPHLALAATDQGGCDENLRHGRSRDRTISRFFFGRLMRPIHVRSIWDDIKVLKIRDGRTLLAYEDDDSHLVVQNLSDGQILWRQPVTNRTAVIHLREDQNAQVFLDYSMVIPDREQHSGSRYVIETDSFNIFLNTREKNQIPAGDKPRVLKGRVSLSNGDDMYLLHTDRHGEMIVPAHGRPQELDPYEMAPADRFAISPRGTTLFTTYRHGRLRIKELANGTINTIWQSRAASNGSLFITRTDRIFVAYRLRSSLIVQEPFAPSATPLILPTPNTDVVWREMANGQILLSTEILRDGAYQAGVYDISDFGRLLYQIPIENRQFKFIVGWVNSAQGENQLQASNGSAKVFRLQSGRPEKVGEFKADIGPGNFKIIDAGSTSYLLMSTRNDTIMNLYGLFHNQAE